MSEQYFYPNSWARIVLTSAEEIVGEKGIAALLNLAGMPQYINNFPPDNMDKKFTFDHIGQLQEAIWEMYGPRGARVFATRAGEQSFQDNLERFGSLASAAQAAMKIGSLEMKVKIGLGFFAKAFFGQFSDQVVSVGEDEAHFIWTNELCPVCWGRTSDQPVCHLAIGVLRAGLAWLSGGKQFRIVETECVAMGHQNCVFVIDKAPMN